MGRDAVTGTRRVALQSYEEAFCVLRNNLAQLFINMDEWHTAKDVPISRHISACEGSEVLSAAAFMAVQIINFVSWLLPAAASVQHGRYAVSASMHFQYLMDYMKAAHAISHPGASQIF